MKLPILLRHFIYRIRLAIAKNPHLVLPFNDFSKLHFSVNRWIFDFFWLYLNEILESLMALEMPLWDHKLHWGGPGMPGNALDSRNWKYLSFYYVEMKKSAIAKKNIWIFQLFFQLCPIFSNFFHFFYKNLSKTNIKFEILR